MTDRTAAWAPVGKESGKVLKDLKGHYAIYRDRREAERDCPKYGEVRRVWFWVSTVKEPA